MTPQTKTITIVSPCYNEEANVEELCERVRKVFEGFPQYNFYHLFIDNASTDRTVEILKRHATMNKHIRIIVNLRNYGHARSPFYGVLQGEGDAVVLLFSDLQDPPELISDFIRAWEKGAMAVMAVKNESEENKFMFLIRRIYYRMMTMISEVRLIENATGFGLYDIQVIEQLRKIPEYSPYFRGMVADLGYPIEQVTYVQKKRKGGKTKNNILTLYEHGMVGVVHHSKLPLSIAAVGGFVLSALSLFVAFGYLVAKLVFWNKFQMGLAPILIGFFLVSSIQLLFIGILGEYVGAIFTQVRQRPLVIEKERVGFEE